MYFWELVEARVEAVVEAHPGGVVCGLDYHPKKEVMITSSTAGRGGRLFTLACTLFLSFHLIHSYVHRAKGHP